jgi:hypothetical protein
MATLAFELKKNHAVTIGGMSFQVASVTKPVDDGRGGLRKQITFPLPQIFEIDFEDVDAARKDIEALGPAIVEIVDVLE